MTPVLGDVLTNEHLSVRHCCKKYVNMLTQEILLEDFHCHHAPRSIYTSIPHMYTVHPNLWVMSFYLRRGDERHPNHRPPEPVGRSDIETDSDFPDDRFASFDSEADFQNQEGFVGLGFRVKGLGL